MSLFEAPRGSILAHACNAQGVWGRGIAVEFKKRFPKAFKEYAYYCTWHPIDVGPIDGTTCLTPEENGYRVACMITSRGYGKNTDEPDDIIVNTMSALQDLLELNKDDEPIYSNKFNSGFFNVPWKETEKVLKQFTNHRLWVVCDPNLEEE